MDEVQSDNSKLTNLKNVTRDFIQHRPEDMIGLISFARRAKVLSPLSFDHKQLINNIDHLQTISKQEEDGTALSYALFKATYLLKSTKLFLSDQASSFKIKDAIIIAVTDGMDNPSALDANNNLRQTSFENVANFAHENGIKLFIINIDPKFTHNNWSAHRRRLQKVTHQTGGDFFTISSANQLPKIYENIDLLQKSSINIGQTEIVESRAFSLYPFLISLGMTLLFISITLKSIYFKVIC